MRKSIKRTFSLFAVVSIFLLVFSGSALASMATATAELDWYLMSATVSSGTISWGDKYTSTDAYAENSLPDFDSAWPGGGDWGVYSATATVATANATGSAGADGDSGATLTATSNAGPSGSLLPYSYASVYRGGTFTYTGTGGTVLFSIPYTLSYDLTATMGAASSAYGYSEVSIVLTRSSGINSVTKWISDLALDNQHLTDSESDIASLVPLHFSNGETGTIEFLAYSEASATIPEPGTLLLLGTGLLGVIGVIGIRRRRRNAKL